MMYLPLLLIPILFVVGALIKPHLPPRIRSRMCAICVAVSLTWIGLFSMWMVGMNIPTLPLAVLMGMSAAGIMYKTEEFFKRTGRTHLWLMRLVVLLGGYTMIVSMLNTSWNMLVISSIATLLLSITILLLMQPTTHKDALARSGRSASSSFINKLDNCC